MYMENNVSLEGSRVQVTGHGPFRGLSGTILMADTIPADLEEEPLYLYLVALEGTHTKEPVWFVHDDLEFVAENAPNAYSTGKVYSP